MFQGEYAAIDNDAGTRLAYPTIDGAVAEAAYMTGFDRNSDIVFAASYAPLLNVSKFIVFSFQRRMKLTSDTSTFPAPSGYVSPYATAARSEAKYII